MQPGHSAIHGSAPWSCRRRDPEKIKGPFSEPGLHVYFPADDSSASAPTPPDHLGAFRVIESILGGHLLQSHARKRLNGRDQSCISGARARAHENESWRTESPRSWTLEEGF